MIRWISLTASTVALATLVHSLPAGTSAQEMRLTPVTRTIDWGNYAPRSDAPFQLASCDAQIESKANGCDDCLDHSCCYTGLYGGVELLWIKPHFEDESAFVIDGSLLDQIVSFNYDHEVSPRFWLGYIGCGGLGARLRYWDYDNVFTTSALATLDVEAFAFSDGGVLQRRLDGDPGDTIFARHDLELQTLDAEATQYFELWNMLFMGSLGLRYTRVEQQYQVLFTSPLGVQEELLHDHNFEGIGPTTGIEVWRPFGGAGLSLYGSLRGSILFGEVDQQIRESTGGLVFVERRDNVDESLAIGELGLGLQWTGSWLYNTDLFIRGGWEGQYWHGAGNANTTTGNMGLEGLTLALGLSR